MLRTAIAPASVAEGVLRAHGLAGLSKTPQPGRPATTGPVVADQLDTLLAHRPHHFGSIEAGWTVNLAKVYGATAFDTIDQARGVRQRS